MDFKKFTESAKTQASPPAEISLTLQALWHAQKGNWSRAHELAQEVKSSEGSWVHAFLHRQEGDESNADYWYARSGHPRFEGSINEELEAIARVLLMPRP